MSTNHIDFTGLRRWFTPKDTGLFFGARSQKEVNEAVEFFGRLKDEDVAAIRTLMAQLMSQYTTDQGGQHGTPTNN